MNAAAALAALGSSRRGLGEDEAARRRALAGPNTLPRPAASAGGSRAGELTEIGAEDLVPGDVLVLEAGDSVSADARVIEAHSLAVEVAALTGESQPSGRTAEPGRAGVAAASPPVEEHYRERASSQR